MTLVIAGRNENNGLFIVADSAITSTGSTSRLVLSSFKKVYPIDIKLWQPYFINESFRDYFEVYYEARCFVAVAGRTLTIQHVLNSITGHLSKLRISAIYDEENMVKYTMFLHCDNKNPLFKNNCYWQEDMFVPKNHYANVYDANKVLDFIEKIILEAIIDAKKYKLDENEFKELLSEYIVGIYCNKTKKHLLTTFKIKHKLDDSTGTIEPYVEREDIKKDSLAVIGMSNKFKAKAVIRYNELLTDNNSDIPNAMFEFLNMAIKEINDTNSKEIYFPSCCYSFNDNNFRLKKIHNPNKEHV